MPTVRWIRNKPSLRRASPRRSTGLIAGTKKVVVVANVPSGVAFPDGINYSWFADARNAMDLETQSPQTNGLFMSGEGTVTLSANSTAATTVSVSRVAAKVKLGTITVSPEAGHDPDKFVLSRAVVMKARGSATMGLPSVNTPELFYGGMAGDKSAEKSYLSETISADDHSNRYFYVFPNDNTGGNATLITLVGTYDGQPAYFPFRINDKPGSDGATSDGTFIQRNHVYTVNVTLKRLGGGSADPEVPADPGVSYGHRRAAGVGDGTCPERRVVVGERIVRSGACPREYRQLCSAG